MVTAYFYWWIAGIFFAAYVGTRVLLRFFDDRQPPEISGPPGPVQQTCPECGRVIEPTERVHFDGLRYRHAWCSTNRGAA